MSRQNLVSRARRAGLVLGGAVLGAAALLAAAAGPAAAASRDIEVETVVVPVETIVVVASADDASHAADASTSTSADFAAPLLAPPQLPSFDDFGLGETRFETMPSFVPGARAPRTALAGATIARRTVREPWLAASLTLAAPAALALPVLAGVWAPALAAPLGLAAGHLYAGDPGRAALVGLGGMGVAGAGAAAGYGLAGWAAMSQPTAMWLGAGLGLGAYSAWAAADAAHTAGQGGVLEVVTVSPR